MHDYDQGSKWMIQHYGDSILRLGGARDIGRRIDRDAPTDVHENLLAVTQVLARLRYNDERLFQVFGGRRAMIESPVLQELKAEWTQEAARKAAQETTRRDIIKVLETRFGAAARPLNRKLKAVAEDKLDDVLKLSVKCRSLTSFRNKIST